MQHSVSARAVAPIGQCVEPVEFVLEIHPRAAVSGNAQRTLMERELLVSEQLPELLRGIPSHE